MAILRFIPVFVFGLLLSGFGQDLAAVEAQYAETTKKAELEYALALNQLTPKYVGALAKYEAQVRDKGDLDGLIAFRAEAKRIEGGLEKVSTYSPVADLARMQKMLNGKIAEMEATRDTKKKAAIEKLLAELKKAQTALTKAGKIEAAVEARNRALELENDPALASVSKIGPSGPASPAAPVAAGNWTVIFRSTTMEGWGKAVNEDGRYSLDQNDVPPEVRYLRIANLANKERVIFPLTRGDLNAAQTRRDDLSWYSANHNGRTMGISSRKLRGADVKVGPFSYGGWGFGEDQEGEASISWVGKSAKGATLEFAVSNADLSDAEKKFLLVDEPSANPGAPIIGSYERRNKVPEKLPNSIVVPLRGMKAIGSARVEGNYISMQNNSQAEWDLGKLPPGSYQVVVTCRKDNSASAGLTAQGGRETTRNKGKITFARGNGANRAIPSDAEPTRVNFGRLRIGGPQKLQLICSSRVASNSAYIYRVELLR